MASEYVPCHPDEMNLTLVEHLHKKTAWIAMRLWELACKGDANRTNLEALKVMLAYGWGCAETPFKLDTKKQTATLDLANFTPEELEAILTLAAGHKKRLEGK